MLPSRAPLLIVPIRDRRQGRRILTIRNSAITLLAVAVLFASISIFNEVRRAPAGQYGRLFGTELPDTNASSARKDDIVEEEPVADESAPDPMLVAPAAREQLLVPKTSVPVKTVTAAPPPVAVSDHGTTIVGDDKGVAIVKARDRAPEQPVLSGGIFKQQ